MVCKGKALIMILALPLSCLVTTAKLRESEREIREDVSRLEERISILEGRLERIEENLTLIEKDELFNLRAYVVEVEAKLNNLERSLRETEGGIEKRDFYLKDEIRQLKTELESIKSFLGEDIYLSLAKESAEEEECEGIKEIKDKYIRRFPSGKHLYTISYLLGLCYEKEGDLKGALKEYGFVISHRKNKYYCKSLTHVIKIMEELGKKEESAVLKKKKKKMCK